MADVNYTLTASVRRKAYDAVVGPGEGANLKVLTATRSVTARTSGDTMKMVRLPSSARLAGSSRIFWDDLASTGSPTLSIGVAAVGDTKNQYTAAPTALNSGLDIATAAGNALLINDHANYGKALWEFMGLASDPGILMDIYVTFAAANTNVTGDVTVDAQFYFD